MASKKTGRLAGLAALAGAAYLASKGKEGAGVKADRDDADRYTGSRTSAAEAATESGDFMSRRLNRIDTDDGRAYSTNNLSPMSPAKSASTKATAPAAEQSAGPTPSRAPGGAAKRGGKSMDELHSSYGPRSGDAKLRDAAFKTPSEGGVSSYRNSTLKRFGAEEREQSDDDRYGSSSAPKPAPKPTSGMGSTITNRPDPRAPSIYAGEEAWAKYRALQKEDKSMKRGGAVKKMASGGMTSSASKRGDGIASKGKTRCKMY